MLSPKTVYIAKIMSHCDVQHNAQHNAQQQKSRLCALIRQNYEKVRKMANDFGQRFDQNEANSGASLERARSIATKLVSSWHTSNFLTPHCIACTIVYTSYFWRPANFLLVCTIVHTITLFWPILHWPFLSLQRFYLGGERRKPLRWLLFTKLPCD